MPEQKRLSLAGIGCGSRTRTYMKLAMEQKNRYRIAAAADPVKQRTEAVRDFAPEEERDSVRLFKDAASLLAEPRLADVAIIGTQDDYHYAPCRKAMELGYHVLLEKPIAETEAECRELERLARQANRHVIVCHVLRYALFYQKLKELLDAGAVGEIQSVQAIERVGYWHQAHSFVRGNWGNAGKSSPMILQKCCHDMDILLWLAGKHCLRVSSFGALSHFNAEHAPAGAPLRCTDGCPAGDTCPYNAERYYMGKLRAGQLGWPLNVVASCPDENSVMAALREGPYGRCVYHCDNDVVDHQVVNLELEGGLTVNFTMSAFTAHGGREIRVMGTRGEIFGDLNGNLLRVMRFEQLDEVIDLGKLNEEFSGHGGGDAHLLDAFLHLIAQDAPVAKGITDISDSVESHLVAYAAERSRLRGGAVETL